MDREPGRRLDWDWFDGEVPENVRAADNAYITTSHAFVEFRSEAEVGLSMAEGAGLYDQSALIIGRAGRVSVGPYTCLSNTYIYAQNSVVIGAHVLTAWGCVITDHWLDPADDLESRRDRLLASTRSREHAYPALGKSSPVTIEDNVWLGFNSIVLPGAHIGRGSVVGARTVVRGEVAPYSVLVGNPARIVRRLDANDSPEATERALREHLSDSGFGANIRSEL